MSCGEASGDLYASELLKALRGKDSSLQAFGLAGERSQQAGLELVVSLSDISVIGLVEVIAKLPALKQAMDRLCEAVEKRRPDVAVLIDFSGFNLRLARRLRRMKVPVVYYVSPQVWAWRRGRVRKIRENVDEMLVILPFEEEMYQKAGVPVRYVGHPLVDLVSGVEDRSAFFARMRLDPDRPVVTLLPGSRSREIELHVPILREVVAELAKRKPELQFVVSRAPTVSLDAIRGGFGEEMTRLSVEEENVSAALRHASAAIVASGTATVEAALMETPMVVVYRVGRLTHAIGKRFVDVPFYSMVNLIAGRCVVPELIQEDMNLETIVEQMLELLNRPARADAMREGLREVRRRLGGGGASQRAAEAVLARIRP